MRILSRPMFKYGGPIKEGVMHGMKNGGSMSNNQGPRRAALVGNPVYPQTGGREHHVWPYLVGQGIYAAGRALARPFGSWAMKNVPKMFAGAGKPTWNIGKGFSSAPGYTKNVSQKVFNPNWLGKQFINDPLAGAVMSGKGFVGGAAKKALSAGKYAFGTPSGLLFLGFPVTIAAGKYFTSDGKEITGDDLNQITQAPQEGVPGGGDPGMIGSGEWFAADAQKKLAAKNKADRKAKIAKYMDTMGYDKAKKSAIGDALIDASAIVQAGTEEGGSLKHADWGKMINQAIQTTSKRLDKPAQIREAIGLMMTKADIQKDLSKETDALAKTKLNLQIKEIESKLNPSAGDIMLAMGDKADKQGMLENIVRSSEGVENLKASFKDEKESAYGKWKDDNKKGDAMKFMNDIVKKDAEFGAGFYVFPTRIVEVKDDLSMSYYH